MAGRYRVPCDLLLNCTAPSIDPTLFRALDRASLVFDGRLIVDSGMAVRGFGVGWTGEWVRWVGWVGCRGKRCRRNE